MNTIFVTGTDTGVGKTLVSAAIIKSLTAKLKVAPFKPVASGSEWIDGTLNNSDALILQSVANVPLAYKEINPYVFEQAIAPHFAARQQKTPVSTEKLYQCFNDLHSKSDFVLIEGAGGWQVPLNESLTIAEWVADMNWPVVLVVGIKLGCLNHARLTCLDMQSRGVKFCGWVANIIDDDVEVREEIIQDLSNWIEAPLIGVVPFMKNPDIEVVSSYLDMSFLEENIN